MTWLKANWKTLLLILGPLLAAFSGGFIAVRAAGPGEQPGIVIIVPGEDPEPLIFGAAADGERNPVVTLAARLAGRRYARQHDGMTATEGIRLMLAVPLGDVKAQCEAEGINPFGLAYELNSRGEPIRGPLIDWLKVPGNLEKLIKIFLVLAPLFAHADFPQPHLLPFDPPCRVAQVPFPLAWVPADCSLAA